MKSLFLIAFTLITCFQAFSQDFELWGTTTVGVQNNTGVIFKMINNGNDQIIEHTFLKHEGRSPEGNMIEASNGKLYGVTALGGVSNRGVLFEYNPSTDTYTVKVNFGGTNSGTFPYGSLVETANGKLYGLTSSGGANQDGVLFEYDPISEVYTEKIDFDSANNGSRPYGSLIESSNGLLYGMTYFGGTNDLGVLFEYDPTANSLTKRLDFDGAVKGDSPRGSLMEGSNGKLYGMTMSGGANDLGVLFEYDQSTNTYTKKLDFDGANNGSAPRGDLMEASNGKFYGMTSEGGLNNNGVVFEFNPTTDVYTKKLDFDGANNGDYPCGSLIEATNGKLYGMTFSGGVNGVGVLFEYDFLSDTYIKKQDFDIDNAGRSVYGDLLEASNGKFYGLSSVGGSASLGVIFEYNVGTNTLNTLLNFRLAYDGGYPRGTVMKASNDKLYGLTPSGGVNNDGVLYEYDRTTGVYTKKFVFEKATTGGSPYGALIEAANGKLYGMTYEGGANDFGVLFEYDPVSEAYAVKLEFDGANNGENPLGSLFEASNGKLYGMTVLGGANAMGVLFEFDPNTDSYNKLVDFDGVNYGRMPYAALMESSNGKLYGLTRAGGDNGAGVLFEYDPVGNVLVKKYDFNLLVDGGSPEGSLIEAANGKLYGLTSRGGVNNLGVLFEYDQSADVFTKKIEFDGTSNGAKPRGSLVEAYNNRLYGVTREGGANGEGVLFEYNYTDDIYSKKLDFDVNVNGAQPYKQLIVLEPCKSFNSISVTSCFSYTVPSGNETYTASGTVMDTIPNAAGCDSIITIDLTINTVGIGVINNSPTLESQIANATYQWIDCNNGEQPIAGETGQSFTATTNGDYAVIVTENNCSDTSACETVNNVSLDLQGDLNTFGIFPNPTKGKVTIELGREMEKISLSVINTLGQEVMQNDYNDVDMFDLQIDMPRGVYIIKLTTPEGLNVTRRIVKK